VLVQKEKFKNSFGPVSNIQDRLMDGWTKTVIWPPIRMAAPPVSEKIKPLNIVNRKMKPERV